MLSAAERAVTIARRVESPRATFLAAIASAIAFVLDGQGEAGMLAARQGVEILDGTDELRDDPRLLAWAALGPMLLRETGIGRGLIELAFERARSQTALGVLPALLHHLARDQATTDRWPAAESSYGESIRLAREIGQRTEHGAALAGLAWLEARQGREDVCRRHAREAQALCSELGLGLYGVWAVQALGDLELALGNVAESVERHLEQVAAMQGLGIADVDLSPAPELVEALLRLGNREEAAAIAATYDAQARAKGQPWVLARAARCRGLLADDADLSACFEEALAHHARTLDVFETARTQLAYGARLRRARQRVRARDELRAAHASFDRLGATLWADVAAAELAATGETARRRDVTTIDELTPQELQIAMLLAAGRTTREAAAAVFLSPKTIEYHLRHVYRKLDINTREALADALGVVTSRVES
jgi:DNA-binding CsgD family transcriptional regulator